MQRVTITLDDELAAEVDRVAAEHGYQGRSEAIRDLIRTGLRQRAEDAGATGDCVAALVYVYDHESRDLSRRLTRIFHDHHDLAVSTLHVHLDHDSCLEATVLRGPATEVQHLGSHVVAERGVRYGRLVTVPAAISAERHHHGQGRRGKAPHVHTHVPRAG
jgi:CopG family nickel-responsive transcriptional regulator